MGDKITNSELLGLNIETLSALIRTAVRDEMNALTENFIPKPLDKSPSLELSLHTSNDDEEAIEVVELMRTDFAVYEVHRKNGDTVYYAQCSRSDEKNKKISRCFHTKAEADSFTAEMNRMFSVFRETGVNLESSQAAAERTADIDTSNGRPTPNWLFKDYCDWYLENGDFTCQTVTIKGYSDSFKLFLKTLEKSDLSGITLGQMTKDVCIMALNKISETKSQQTLTKCKNTIKKCINFAFECNILSGADFSERIKCKKSSVETEPRMAYTDEELNILKSCSKSDKLLHTIICVLSSTGLRPEELRALQWKNINLESKTLNITNAIVKVHDDLSIDGKTKYHEKLGKTKSKKGVRTLPLSDEAAAALKEWKAYSDNLPNSDKTDYVFFNDEGNFLSADEIAAKWRYFTNKYSLKGYILYRFRHTFCTRLFKAKARVNEVQALMGDATIDVIMKIYNHLDSADLVDDMRETVNTLS